MAGSKSLPNNPSLDFERKQAKALLKAFRAAEKSAVARIGIYIADAESVSLRDAQLVIAREYDYSSWTELKSAILEKSGPGLEWAVGQATQAIHDNDADRLRELLGKFPELLDWQDPDEDSSVMLQETTSYANFVGDQDDVWNRPESAKVLLDAGARMDPRVYMRVIDTASYAMLDLFNERGLLPRNLRVLAALGDEASVQACFDSRGVLRVDGRPADYLTKAYPGADRDWPDPADDRLVVADALLYACRLNHRGVAAILLAKSIQLDPDLAQRLESWQGEKPFVEFLCDNRSGIFNDFDDRALASQDEPGMVWRQAMLLRVNQAMEQNDADQFRRLMRDEPYLLGPEFVDLQRRTIELATFSSCSDIIKALLDANPAIKGANPPPKSGSIVYALECGNADYIPMLSAIWPIPIDLPHAAGIGDLEGVARWFDENGKLALGDTSRHYPGTTRSTSDQEVLDYALAWACVNGEFDVADFLLERGADINCRWSTHEPASILHECAWYGRLAAVKFLVERGIDRTIKDHRFEATALGWANYAEQNEIVDYLKQADESGE
jgi:hypothetical protein